MYNHIPYVIYCYRTDILEFLIQQRNSAVFLVSANEDNVQPENEIERLSLDDDK